MPPVDNGHSFTASFIAMGNRPDLHIFEPSIAPDHDHTNAVTTRNRELYFNLLKPVPAPDALRVSRTFLDMHLRAAQRSFSSLPLSVHEWLDWMQDGTDQAGIAYRAYLSDRKNGAPRRYFSCRSHALHFLRHVAPTKMVDGAWLYSTLQQWRDPDYHELIRTYLEELGDGQPEKNHVVLYRQLLLSTGCDAWQDLPDACFEQGAVQLALAHAGDSMLPEIVGFNLGYEQLPLHLLITAYELDELGIDPYYFTLHVTVDNASTGHAHKAVEAALRLRERATDPDDFTDRLMKGFALNHVGIGSTAVITSFDLEDELEIMLTSKATVGKYMHSDFCRIGGRTVNQWLAIPNGMRDFLQVLQDTHWIERGKPVEYSRFWQLIEGTRARMFGVFTEAEKQLLRDWITEGNEPAVRPWRHQEKLRAHAPITLPPVPVTPPVATSALPSHDEMDALIPLLSPACHHLPDGLAATCRFSESLHG